jgi:hypothetical protein
MSRLEVISDSDICAPFEKRLYLHKGRLYIVICLSWLKETREVYAKKDQALNTCNAVFLDRYWHHGQGGFKM